MLTSHLFTGAMVYHLYHAIAHDLSSNLMYCALRLSI